MEYVRLKCFFAKQLFFRSSNQFSVMVEKYTHENCTEGHVQFTFRQITRRFVTCIVIMCFQPRKFPWLFGRKKSKRFGSEEKKCGSGHEVCFVLLIDRN